MSDVSVIYFSMYRKYKKLQTKMKNEIKRGIYYETWYCRFAECGEKYVI